MVALFKLDKIEPMEIAPAPSEDEDDDDDEADAMESLLPGESGGTTGLMRQRSKGKPAKTYLNGLIQPQPIGNMHVLFPEKFRTLLKVVYKTIQK